MYVYHTVHNVNNTNDAKYMLIYLLLQLSIYARFPDPCRCGASRQDEESGWQEEEVEETEDRDSAGERDVRTASRCRSGPICTLGLGASVRIRASGRVMAVYIITSTVRHPPICNGL